MRKKLSLWTRDELVEYVRNTGKENVQDEYFGTMCVCAVRYSIGRMTYMPSIVQQYIRSHLNVLDDGDIYIMIHDIRSERNLGSDYDKKEWLALAADLETEMKRRGEVSITE